MQDESLESKLDVVIRLLALHAVKKMEYNEQVRLLMTAGLGYKEIAAILGKTENNVAVTMNSIKKGGKKNVKRSRNPK